MQYTFEEGKKKLEEIALKLEAEYKEELRKTLLDKLADMNISIHDASSVASKFDDAVIVNLLHSAEDIIMSLFMYLNKE